MKRSFLLTLLLLFIFFTLSFKLARGAAPYTGAAFDVETALASTAYAQSDIRQFENISTEQGLSQSTVTAILQDKQGFMWFGTEGGLNRYDGYQFSVYKHDPDDPQSLASNVVYSIYEDRDGSLWVGTSHGLDRLNRETGSFTHYQQEFTNPAALNGVMVSIIRQDRASRLWVGTEDAGLAVLDLKTKQSTIYQHNADDPKTISSNTVRSIFEDQDGVLWIGTDRGLDRFDPTSETFIHPNLDSTLLSPLTNNPIYAINEDSQGILWLGAQNGLFQWDRATGQFRAYFHYANNPTGLSDNSIRCIFMDSQGVLWVGTRSGLNRFDGSQRRFIRYNHDPNDPQSLGSDSIRAVYEDHSGVLWVGTAAGGLSKYAPASHKFILYKNRPSEQNSLSDSNIWSVYEDHNGALWVGTFSAGLNRLDRSSGAVTVYKNDPTDSTSLSRNDIRVILEDRHGDLWVGTEYGGLNRFNPQTGKFVRYQHKATDSTSLSNDNVFSMYEDHMGRLWIGTQGGGLNLFDPITGVFTHYLHDAQNPSSLSDDTVRAIYEDRTGALWVGTFGGVSLLDERTNRFTSYRNDPDNPSSLSNNLISSILEDSEGMIWIGTIGGGLDRFDRLTQTFTHYTEKDGLPDDTIYGILAGSDGALWMSTNKGISKFDPRRETFRNYDVSDGLQGNQFNPGAFFQSQEGELFFGGSQGLNVFFPRQVTDNPIPPPVVITAFKKFNQPAPVVVAPNQTIQLSYRDTFISFEFAALDFNAPAKNQYAYKLEGFDQDWVQAGTRRYASYTNLPGGSYVFRVEGSNNDGVWNETGIAIPITVAPPFWRTWWFYGLMALLLVTLITGGFRWRLKAVREQNVHLETEIAERTSELRETNVLLEKEVEQRKRAEQALAKRAADELEQSEARFRAMFENAGIGIGLVGLNRRPIEVNSAFAEITGYNPQELVQMTGADLSYIEDKEIGTAELQDVLEGKLNSFQVEKRYLRKNGKVYWVRLTNSVVRTPEGKPQYMVTMLEDIDEQKKSADELHSSQARFQAIFENVAVGIAIMTLERKPINLNPVSERIMGYSAEELRNVDPRLLAVPEDRGIDTDLFKEMIEGKRDSYVMERRYRRKDGRIFWARINYSLVRDLEGKPDYLVGMVEDIDDQKRVAERLAAQEADYRRELERRVEERTLALQHQIEQRQKAEQALAEKAAQEAVAGERTRLARDLHDAVTQTLFSASLIAEVLPDIWDLNEVEGRKRLEELRQLTRGALAEMRTLLVELRPNALTEIPLPDLLRQLCESLIGRARLPIQLNVDGKQRLSPDVQISLYRITQEALNNVVKHAKATQVVVVLRLDGDVRLSVADNGCGFDPAAVPPDHLGIKIMHERADAIGADLSIYSEPGEGTQISVMWKERG